MIMVQALLIAGVSAADLRTYPLEEQCVYTVRLGLNQPTTCVFPGPLKALVGANISAKPDEHPGILLSHEPGAEFFSLRAMKEDATGAMNVVFRGKVYALAFTTVAEPDQAVVFLDEPLVGRPRPLPEAGVLQELLDRSKQLGRLQQQYPGMKPAAERLQPNTVIRYRDFAAVIEEVTRFDAEDALAFRVRLENPGDAAVVYDPQSLAIRVGREIFPAALAEASGSIPAKSSAWIHLLVAGAPGRGRVNLSVRENFNLIVAHP